LLHRKLGRSPRGFEPLSDPLGLEDKEQGIRDKRNKSDAHKHSHRNEQPIAIIVFLGVWGAGGHVRIIDRAGGQGKTGTGRERRCVNRVSMCDPVRGSFLQLDTTWGRFGFANP
jgi:hypothetical protein